MATPSILIEQVTKPPGTAGVSRTDLVTGQVVTCTDAANGAGTYSWTLLSKPLGSGVTLAGAATATATFTPDVSGTYLLSVIFNGTDASGTTNSIGQFISTQGGAAVLLANGIRVPAAGETLQFSSTDGWSDTLDPILRAVDSRLPTANQKTDITTTDGAAQGTIFYSNSSGRLAPLAPGSDGRVLTTHGTANPTWEVASAGGAASLDEAYDGGGAGAGRTIVADTGAVAITGTDVTNTLLDVSYAGSQTSEVVTSITMNETGGTNPNTTGIHVDMQQNTTNAANSTGIKVDLAGASTNRSGMLVNVNTGETNQSAYKAQMDGAGAAVRVNINAVASALTVADQAASTRAMIELTRGSSSSGSPVSVSSAGSGSGVAVSMTGASSGAGIDVANASGASGHGIHVANSGSGVGVLVDVAGTTANRVGIKSAIIGAGASTQSAVYADVSGTGKGLYVKLNDGAGLGKGVVLEDTADQTARMLELDRSATSSGSAIYATSGSSKGVELAMNGSAAKGLEITNSASSGQAVHLIANAAANTGTVLQIDKSPGSSTAGNLMTLTAGANTTGIPISVSNAGSGNGVDVALTSAASGHGIHVQNLGTGNGVLVDVAGTTANRVGIKGAIIGVGAATQSALNADLAGTGRGLYVNLNDSAGLAKGILVNDTQVNTVPMVDLERSTGSSGSTVYLTSGSSKGLELALNGSAAKGLEITNSASSGQSVHLIANATANTGAVLQIDKSPGSATAGNLISLTAGANSTGIPLSIANSGTHGDIKFASRSADPGSVAAGETWYNSTIKAVKFNDGTNTIPLKFEYIVNVKWYGAKGDGVTDDRVAIQTAINACRDSGLICCLYFPVGTYLATRTVDNNGVGVCLDFRSITTGMVIMGDGPGVSTIKMSIDFSQGVRLIRPRDSKNLFFYDLSLDGGWSGEAGDEHIQLTEITADTTESSDIYFQRVWFTNNRGDGFRVLGTNTLYVRRCHAWDCKFINVKRAPISIQRASIDCSVLRCYIESGTDSAIDCEGSGTLSSSRWDISHNIINHKDSTVSFAVSLGGGTSGMQDSTFAFNRVVGGAIDFFNLQNSHIIGNKVESLNGSSAEASVRIRRSNDLTFCNNVVIRPASATSNYVFIIATDTIGCTNINVSNNIFQQNTANHIVYTASANKVKFIGNSLEFKNAETNTHSGFFNTGTLVGVPLNDILIANNTIYGDSGGGTLTAGVYVNSNTASVGKIQVCSNSGTGMFNGVAFKGGVSVPGFTSQPLCYNNTLVASNLAYVGDFGSCPGLEAIVVLTSGRNTTYEVDSSPEGNVTGSPGDFCHRVLGGAAGTLTYQKITGTATKTGWTSYGLGGSVEISKSVDPANQSYVTGVNVLNTYSLTAGYRSFNIFSWTLPPKLGNVSPGIRFTWSDASTTTRSNSSSATLTEYRNAITFSKDGLYINKIELIGTSSAGSPENQNLSVFSFEGDQLG